MPNAILRGSLLDSCQISRKENQVMQVIIGIIGLCAAAMLLWYVYILMKGDNRA